MSKLALILINVGSPYKLDIDDSQEFIYEMLSDKHIMKVPFLLRKILASRIAKKSACRFLDRLNRVAIDGNSPLRYYTRSLREKLSDRISVSVLSAYMYSGPKIRDAVMLAKRRGATEYVFIPLYPQYLDSTTLSAKEQVEEVMEELRRSWSFCEYYWDEPLYIDAIASSCEEQMKKSEALVVSFHSIPEKDKDKSSYVRDCEATVKLIAERFPNKIVTIAWQSAMKKNKWLCPSVEEVVKGLVDNSVKNISVVCAGFALECTETLYDIDITLREYFKSIGGENFEYVKCLNDSEAHVDLLENLFYKYE
ncbi:MAG: ferrochelatase [Opitutales bacterium]